LLDNVVVDGRGSTQLRDKPVISRELEELTDELIHLRVLISLESDRIDRDDMKLAEMRLRLRDLERQVDRFGSTSA